MDDRNRKSAKENQPWFVVGIVLVAGALADRFLGLYVLTDVLRLLVLAAGCGLIFWGIRSKKRPGNDRNHRQD